MLQAQPGPAEISANERLIQLKNDTATVAGLIRASAGYQNKPDSAIFLLQKAFSLSHHIGYTDGCARALLGIGTNLFNKGEIEKARTVFRRAYPYCQRAFFTKNNLLWSWHNNMASSYAVQGNYDSAAQYYYKALDNMAQAKQQDAHMYVTILANLGTVWHKASQFRKSLFYSQRALYIATAIKDSNKIADIYQVIGLALDALGDHANSLPALRKAYNIHLQQKNFITAQMDACALAMNTTNTDSALYYYHTAIDLSKNTAMEPLHKIYIGLGYTYLQRKDYANAIVYLNKGMGRAKQLGFTADLTFVYAGLADAYTATNNYKLANTYRRAYDNIRDSILNIEKMQSANTLEVKYRTAEKDRQLAQSSLRLLTSDYKLKQKNYLLILISLGLIILGLTLFSFYRNTRRRQKMELQQQELDNLKAVMAGEEKERTRVARELHDGIMVQLAVIKMKLRKAQSSNEGDYEEILKQLDTTTRELRQTAHNLMPDMLLENGLTDALFYLCTSLQKETGLNIIFQHYGELPPLIPDSKLYLYRVVQELLQNIIKHAHATKALVQMNYHPPFVSFSVEDNGIGFDKQLMDTGMGLKSIYSRLKVLNATIDIKSSKHLGTTIFIELNIEPFIEHKTNNDVHQGSYS